MEKKNKNGGRIPLIITAAVLIVAVIAVVIVIGFKEHNKNVATPDTAQKALDAGKYSEYARSRVLEVGDYKNFSYAAYSYEVTDELIEKTYSDMVESYRDAGITAFIKDDERDDDEIKNGDTVNIDYTGYIEGVPFDRGADTDFNLTVGSGSFLADFENGLIGHRVGEKFDVTATFPEDYSLNTELAGISAVFSVTVNYICKETELTEDNAYKAVLYMNSKEELFNYLKEYLSDNPAETEADHINNAKASFVQQIVDGSRIENVDADVDERFERVKKLYEGYAAEQSLSLEDFVVSGLGYSSLDSFETLFLEAARVQVKNELLFTVIAENEGIVLDDATYNVMAQGYAAQAGYQTVSEYEQEYDKTYGSGTLRNYVRTVYVQEVLFEKYAKTVG